MIKSDNFEKKPTELKCPKCGSPIAWYVESIGGYICSSDWNGINEDGSINVCRSCVADSHSNHT